MKKKNKGGRPKKSDAEKLKYPVKFMLKTGDYYPLKAKAKSAGLRITEFARLAVTGVTIKPRLTVEEGDCIRKLSGLSNNLNQLARSANKSGFEELAQVNWGLAREIFEIVKRIRDDGKDKKG